MLQLIFHLLGDYVLQSDWMAQGKTKATWPACCHALVYSLPFLFIGSLRAVAVIFATHVLIDRFRLARYVAWAKNRLAPPRSTWIERKTVASPDQGQPVEEIILQEKLWWEPWSECSATGYHKDTPVWLASWLLIIVDNTMHIAINYAALSLL